jgi:DNA-binding CsgD family transcriptional regulator
MIGAAELLGIIAGIYDAGLDASQWSRVLEQVSDAVSGGSASLTTSNMQDGSSSALMIRADPDWQQRYMEYYCYRNPFRPLTQNTRPIGVAHTSGMLMPRDRFERTEFYNDYIRPQGWGDCLRVPVFKDHVRHAVVAVIGIPSRGRFGAEHLNFLNALAPHLQRAIELNRQLGPGSFARHSLDALNALPQGTIVTDSVGRVKLANAAAERIVRSADGLSIDRTRTIRASRIDETDKMHRLIRDAAYCSGARGGVMPLSRPSGRRPLSVFAAPSRSESRAILDDGPYALLFIVDPESSPDITVTRLMVLLGITPMQAAVAVQILRGGGLEAAAARLGIARTTARTHLKSVFERIGVSRQSELVRYVHESQAGLPGEN